MVKVPAVYDHLEVEVRTVPVPFASFQDTVVQIREERTAERHELYLRAVLGTIEG